MISEHAEEVLEEHAAKHDTSSVDHGRVEVDNHKLAGVDAADDDVLGESAEGHADVVDRVGGELHVERVGVELAQVAAASLRDRTESADSVAANKIVFKFSK